MWPNLLHNILLECFATADRFLNQLKIWQLEKYMHIRINYVSFLMTYPRFSKKCVFLPTVISVTLKWRRFDKKITAIHRDETAILALQPFIRRYGWTLCVQYACYICAKLQIDCFTTLEGVDYTNLLPYIETCL